VKKRIAAFAEDRRAGVALMFALIIVPILIAVGVGVDFARRHDMRTPLQEAADAAAIAAARNADLSSGEIDALVDKIIANNFRLDNVVDADVARVPKANSVEIVINGKIETSFLKIAGFRHLDVGVRAEAALPKATEIEVVFVLDYSSSMSDQYEEMRDAAVALVDALDADATGASFEAAVVPFAAYVHGTFPSEYIIGEPGGGSWTNCTMSREWPFVIEDTEPGASSQSRWGSTDDNLAIDADEYDDCAPYAAQDFEITRLTDNLPAVAGAINALTPVYGTNIALGLEIARSVISPGHNWGGADDFGPNVKKYVVLLTDGDQHEIGPGAGGWTVEQAKENIVSVCDAMLDDGIGLFAIAYQLDDPAGKDVLQDCADGGGYYLEASTSTIDEVFMQVKEAIKMQPHLVK
jgi:hypothetical protein